MKKWMIRLLVGVSLSVCAEDFGWMTVTGKVTQIRHGKADFYTFSVNDGSEYTLNSVCPAGREYAGDFQNAYDAQNDLVIDFRSIEKHPGSIWFIRSLKNVEVPSRELKVSGVFKNGMVLQRDMPVPIWGWALPGAEITVELSGQKKSGVANGSGRWQVLLAPMSASSKPREMIISSNSNIPSLRYSNLLVGDVWVLAGQSNMDFWLESSTGGKEAAEQADYPWLRMFDPGWQLPDEPAGDVVSGASWTECAPQTAGRFSAVGFWMAKMLHEELDVPIGLLKTSVSGTYGECWVPRSVLETIPSARPRLAEYDEALEILPQETERWKKEKAEWAQQATEARKNGGPEPVQSFFVRKGPMGPNHFHRPNALYNGRVAPLMPFAVRGVVWYQGEGNSQAHRVGYYKDLLRGLISSWRDGWKMPELPFLVVQLPKFTPGQYNDWPQLREAQRTAVEGIRNADLVVTIDTGDPKDIHPKDKKPVARRVAALALQQVYGQDMPGRSPAPCSIKKDGAAFLVSFSDVGAGLDVRGVTPRCFELAGSDESFFPAVAELVSGDTVHVSSPDVPEPVQVRYAYSNTPDVNLFSSFGLPVVPFVIDHSEYKDEFTANMGALPGEPPYLKGESEQMVPMGKLDNFYRQSQLLGSWLKTSYFLDEVPDYYLELGDFPYKKKPSDREVLFADRLSVSRFLGGWGPGYGGIKDIEEARSFDLVQRAEDGTLSYHWGGQLDHLSNYLASGISDVILSIDNIPYALALNPKLAAFGQSQPQRDIKEWQEFFDTFLDEMGARYGDEFMNAHVGFRVGTEFNRMHTYTGTFDTYVDWYDHAAQSVKSRFPGAKIGLCEIAGWMEPGADNVFFPDVVDHIVDGKSRATGAVGNPLDFVANSSHAFPRWTDDGQLVGCIDPRERAWINADLYRRLLGGRETLISTLPAYVFQFGILRSEVRDKDGNYLATSEPGARGAVWQFIALMETKRQWPALKGVCHWDTYERFYGGAKLMKGIGWMYNLLDHMQGREMYALVSDYNNETGGFCKAYAFIDPSSSRQYIMAAAFNSDRNETHPLQVSIQLPSSVSGTELRHCKLTFENSPYTAMRNDLETAGLLPSAFVENPRLVAEPRSYAGKDMELKDAMNRAVAPHFDHYCEMVKESFVLQPLDAVLNNGTLNLTMEVPSLYLIEVTTN